MYNIYFSPIVALKGNVNEIRGNPFCFLALSTAAWYIRLGDRHRWGTMSFEDKVDEAAQRLAIESRSLLGVPKDPEGCRDRWIRRLPHPPEALNFARHVWRHVPVLVENCIQDRPCWYKWHSSEYMIKAMGQRHVQVALTPNGRADDIHLHEGRDVFVLPQETQMCVAVRSRVQGRR